MASFLYFFRSRPALFAILMAGLVLALACFARVLHEARFSTNDYEASSVTTSDDGTEALNQIFQETLEISSEAVDDSGLTTMERRTTDNQKDKEDAISGFTFTPGDQSESEPSEEFSRVALENALADSDVFVFSEPDDVEAPSADSSKESNLVAEDPITSLKALQDQIDREEKNNDEMRNEVAGTEAEEKTGFDFLAVEETPSEEKIVLNPAVGEPVDPQESFPTDLIVSSTKEKISALDVAMESEPSELSEKETTDEDTPLVVTLFGDSDHSTPQTTTDSSRNDLDLSSNDELVSHPESQGTTDGTKTEEADSMEIEDGSRVHVVLEEDEDVEFFDILVNNKPASKRTESEENSGNVEHSYAPVPKPFDKVGAEFDPVATDETASTVPEGETNDATDELAENVVKSLDSTEETVGTPNRNRPQNPLRNPFRSLPPPFRRRGMSPSSPTRWKRNPTNRPTRRRKKPRP